MNRGKRGKRVGLKLNAILAREVFHAEGTYKEIGDLYNISPPLVHYIKKGLRWNSATGLPHLRPLKGEDNGKD